ncbi:MAG: guanosine monophosphate reductase [Betaproteobacteria bacterium]
MKKGLTYDDVLLVPQYSDIESRSEVSLATELGRGVDLKLPIISSPMDTVSETDMAGALGDLGGLSIIHRYNSIEEQAGMIASLGGEVLVGAAVGIAGDYIDRAIACVEAGAKVICVDVAHGHHILMKKAIKKIRKAVGKKIHIMAGNVATLEGFNDLADWGADSIRCNIGGGSICTTRVQTGHGVPGLETIFQCSKSDRNAKIIADGGIKNSGDIVKALAAGADAVMLGSLLAGTSESPGRTFKDADGKLRKVYRGMASAEAQKDWRGRVSSQEGVSSSVPWRGPVGNVIEGLERGIRSGLSYSGARSVKELQAKAQWLQQSNASTTESSAHIRLR